jgi:ABC-2 type transport system permease protein
MTRWRLEWLRLIRTHRIWILVGLYAFFGVTGPLTAAYLPEIMARFGGDLQVVVPDPTPAAGMVQFSTNAGQLGLLAVLVVAAGAVTFDTRPPWSSFLRTRVPRMLDLVLPPLVVMWLAAAASMALGTTIAAATTTALIGAPDPAAVVVGMAYGALYLGVAVAVVAVAASVARTAIATVLLAVVVLLVLPVFQLIPTVGSWIPSRLLGAGDAMLMGVPAGDFAVATVVAVVAIPALVALAAGRLGRREV